MLFADHAFSSDNYFPSSTLKIATNKSRSPALEAQAVSFMGIHIEVNQPNAAQLIMELLFGAGMQILTNAKRFLRVLEISRVARGEVPSFYCRFAQR